MFDRDAIAIAIVIVGSVLAAYLLLIGLIHIEQPFLAAVANMADAFAAPFNMSFSDRSRNARLREIDDEIRRAVGDIDDWGERERADIVSAAIAAQRINVLNQLLRKSVGQCLDTHWAVAEGSGAIHMSEAARHPLSRRLRQRVIDISDLLTLQLVRYPLILEAPELIRLQLGLRWIPVTCATCPYWTASVSEAPRVCPTATAMGRRPSNSAEGSVVEGEVVNECDTHR